HAPARAQRGDGSRSLRGPLERRHRVVRRLQGHRQRHSADSWRPPVRNNTVTVSDPSPVVNSPSPANGVALRRWGLGWRQQRKASRSEEHTSELQSPCKLVCRLLLEKKN